jgi:hypothetical protein
MSTKTTLVLALAAEFLGGVASQHIGPALVYAQAQTPPPQDIRVRKVELVDENGVTLGVFGFARDGNPELQVKSNGHVMTARFSLVLLNKNRMLK